MMKISTNLPFVVEVPQRPRDSVRSRVIKRDFAGGGNQHGGRSGGPFTCKLPGMIQARPIWDSNCYSVLLDFYFPPPGAAAPHLATGKMFILSRPG